MTIHHQNDGNLVQIEFHGDTLWAVREDGEWFVAIKPICDRLGIAWHGQRERVNRDTILAEGTRIIRLPSPGGSQETTLLRLDLLNGWLFGIEEARIKDPAIRDRVLLYKRECFAVLFHHFFGPRDAVAGLPSPADITPATIALWLADAPLGSRIDGLRYVERVFGREVAKANWSTFGLPELVMPPNPLAELGDSDESRAVLEAILNIIILRDNTGAGEHLYLHQAALIAMNETDGKASYALKEWGVLAPVTHRGEEGIAIANGHPKLRLALMTTRWADRYWYALRRLPGCRAWKGLGTKPLMPGMGQARMTFVSERWLDPALRDPRKRFGGNVVPLNPER